jgi:hypothetical protein
MLPTIMRKDLPVLAQMNLAIFTTEDDLGFNTSDHPCVWFDPEGGRRPATLSSRTIGRRVYYGTLADSITSLEEAQAAGRLQARLKILTHPALLVDEIGYLPITRSGAMLFFQLMTRRYERASIQSCDRLRRTNTDRQILHPFARNIPPLEAE